MKKKLVISFLLVSLKVCSIFATGYPVLDIANLMQAVDSAMNYYQQLQNTIEQVQNTYKQIEQAAQQMASMDWDSIKDMGNNFSEFASNPFENFSKIKTTASDIKNAAQQEINKVKNLRSSLTNESISFGGVNVSVAELCGIGGNKDQNLIGFAKNAWNTTVETSKEAVAGYVGKLTYEQKQEIVKKYGISADTYASLELANYQLSELMKDANVSATIQGQLQMLQDCENSANAIQTMAQNLPDGSVFAATQLVSSSLAEAERQIGNIHATINKGFGLVSQYFSAQKAEDDIKNQQEVKNRENDEKKLRGESLDDFTQDML